MYLVNFLLSAAFDVQEEIESSRETKDNKYQYKVNLNELVGILKDKLILAIAQHSPDKQTEMLNDILDEAKRFVVPIRPNRTTHRNPSPRSSEFSPQSEG